MVRWLTQASVVIGACVSTGLVALLASGSLPVHPPVWPPVGVALAALVVSRRLWPAVAVAAALLALIQLRRSADLPWPELLAGAAAVGLLYAVQALPAAGSSAGPSAIHSVSSASGGPGLSTRLRTAHTLIASAAGTALYCVLGVVAWPDWSGAWLRWWCGDAAGGLAFARIALALGRPTPRGVATSGGDGRRAADPCRRVGRAGRHVRARPGRGPRPTARNGRGRPGGERRRGGLRPRGRQAGVRARCLPGGRVHPAGRAGIHPARLARRSPVGRRGDGHEHRTDRPRRPTGDVREGGPAGRPGAAGRLSPVRARAGQGGDTGRARDRHVVIYQVEPPTRDAIGFDAASDPARADTYRRAAETGRPAVASSGAGSLLVVVPIPERPCAAEVRGFVTASLDTDAWLAALPSEAGLQFGCSRPRPRPPTRRWLIARSRLPGSRGNSPPSPRRTTWPLTAPAPQTGSPSAGW